MLARALVLIGLVLALVPALAHAQTPALDYQRAAILAALARNGVVAGQVITIGLETYSLKEIVVTFDRGGSPTIVIKTQRLQ